MVNHWQQSEDVSKTGLQKDPQTREGEVKSQINGFNRPDSRAEKNIDMLYWKKVAVIENIKGSTVNASLTPGKRFFAEFTGASLLSLNELTRTESRLLSNYKKVWSEKSRLAVELVGGIEELPLKGDIQIHLWRCGGKIVDNEGLPAAFKYLIDGLRDAGILQSGAMDCVVSMNMHQKIGRPAIAVEFLVNKLNTRNYEFWPTLHT